MLALGVLGLAGCSRSEPQQAAAPAEPMREERAQQTGSKDDDAVEAEPAPAPGLVDKPKKKSERRGPTTLDEPEAEQPRDLLDSTPTTLEQAERQLAAATEELERLYGGALAKAQPLAAGDTRCQEACRAFASLERASDAICRLTDDEHQRCVRAKRLVGEHEKRLRRCDCDD